LLIVLAGLMVSTMPYFKFAMLKKLPKVLWLVLAAALVLNAQIAAWLVSGLYLLSGPAIWLHQRRTAAAA
jgi:CDP-diacylglycerol---serine O-phosphatidyltransferase